MKHRSLTDAELAELDGLNKAVRDAIYTRRLWLDAKMLECSNIKPGDELFDVESGRVLGVVSRLYRYWSDRDEGVRDTSFGIEYEFKTDCGFDNTSRQPHVDAGTREMAVARAEARARWLRA